LPLLPEIFETSICCKAIAFVHGGAIRCRLQIIRQSGGE